MERVLIISYFFPPCNLTASERVFSWARHLRKFGYYPVVITRRWDNPIKNMVDISRPTPPEVFRETTDEYEVYYMPYKPNLKDRIYTRFENNKWVMLRKALSAAELILQNYANYFIPFRNIGDFALEYLGKNPDITKVIISGNPYIQFKFGYQLKKKYNIDWVADYRDAWTTTEIDLIGRGPLFKFIRQNDRDSEVKWVGSSSAVTSVSEPILNEIVKLVNVQGKWVSNGFEFGEFDNCKNLPPFEKFTVSYIGTLYYGQQIEIFCEAFKKLVDSNTQARVHLLFPGLAFHKDQNERIKQIMKGYENYFSCTERTSKNLVLETEVKSHLLLYPAWKGFNGIIPSKIYEYIGSGTYTLVTPSDQGEVEKIVNQSGCGKTTNTVQETFEFLQECYNEYLKGNKLKTDPNGEKVRFFSREYQASRMADLLHSFPAKTA